MDSVVPRPDQDLRTVRQRRAELRESMSALERALAAPVPGRAAAWTERVREALLALSADLRVHVEITEGPDGLYRGVLATAPRLSNAVNRLSREHGRLQELIDDLLGRVREPAAADGAAVTRERGTALLAQLIRHRQRGADLVYEAYATDIGGEA
jgi:hypothetical protein